jgi:transcriptional regulator with XRE-family HTH domain
MLFCGTITWMPSVIRVFEGIMAATRRPQSEIAAKMQRRRKALRISCKLLALHSGVSLPTVQRILRDGGEHTTYANLAAVARALGMDFELRSTSDEQAFAERQAEAKARVLVRMVQGTSALESQAVDSDTYQQMVKQTVHELMAGPGRKLWNPM